MISEVCSDFSYIVPSPWKQTAFEFMVEITEPGKFTDVIFQLLCAYHKDFCIWQGEDFHTSAARYFKKAASTGIILPTPGAGLVAIAQHQLQLFGE